MFQVKKKTVLMLLTGLLCLGCTVMGGCSAGLKSNGADQGAISGSASAEGWSADRSKGEGEAPEAQSQSTPRFVIRSGSLNLTVRDTHETVEKVERMAADSGGVVSESNVYETRDSQYAAELTLRIPESDFDRFITALQELGDAANIHKSSEDVTLTYLDRETRIKNLQAEEERLREILTAAETVEEILKVEQELFRVRGEIEAMTTAFTYLQEQVSLSTVRVLIREEAIGTQGISQKPFANMGKRLKEALFRSINSVSSAAAFVLIALTSALPVLAAIALAVLVVVWLVRAGRRRRRRNLPPGGHTPAVS